MRQAARRRIQPVRDGARVTHSRAADADVWAVLRELVTEVQALRLTIERLEHRSDAGRGPRDGADVALIPAIVAAAGQSPFTSRQLFDQADAALQRALTAADLTTVRALGKLLHRLQGLQFGDWTLEREGSCRAGVRWRLRVCGFETRKLAPGDDDS